MGLNNIFTEPQGMASVHHVCYCPQMNFICFVREWFTDNSLITEGISVDVGSVRLSPSNVTVSTFFLITPWKHSDSAICTAWGKALMNPSLKCWKCHCSPFSSWQHMVSFSFVYQDFLVRNWLFLNFILTKPQFLQVWSGREQLLLT